MIWRTFVAIIGTKKRNTEFLDLNKILFILICFPSYIQTPLRTSPGAAFVYTFRASQSLPPVAAKKQKSFFAGARTWRKILLRMQVWNLSPPGTNSARADCKTAKKVPRDFFGGKHRSGPHPGRRLYIRAFVYKSVHFAKSLGFSLDTHGGSAIISKDLNFW